MSERTRALIDADKRYVWHPFTQMREWNDGEPLVIERGEGNYLIDSEGRRYLDGVSSLWVTVHGHGRAEINRAIAAQLERIAHTTLLGLANGPSIELAQRLVQIAPDGLEKVFYSDSGSTAVEIALKIAYQSWRQRGRPEKRLFVALENAYHGDTIGAVSVGGIDLFHGLFGDMLFDVLRVPSGDADALASLLEARGDEVAALIVEPLVQGAAGMLMQPEGYLREAADLCRAHDVLLIADEVATGFGRTGRMFACEHEGVQPDLMCLAKGITGGYLPLAATLATRSLYECFLGAGPELKQFFHGHTYTGNPLACAAALASLDIFERERTVERAAARGVYLAEKIGERLAGLAAVGAVRQRGLMVGIELGSDEPGLGARVCAAARQYGVILRPLGNVIVLMPPLSIETDELDVLVSAVERAIADCCA